MKKHNVVVNDIPTTAPRHRSAPACEEQLVTFVAHYYGDDPARRLEPGAPGDAYWIAANHFRLAKERNHGSPNIAIYSPTVETHGWQSNHSVVDVVNDDMPFLVDSITMLLNRHGIGIHKLLHPILAVARDSSGQLMHVASAGKAGARHESFIHIEIERVGDIERIAALQSDILQVLTDIRDAVFDSTEMQARVYSATTDVANAPVSTSQRREALAFLRWLEQHNFIFLGYVHCTSSGDAAGFRRVAGSGLGVLRNETHPLYGRCLAGIPAAIVDGTATGSLLTLVKADARSTIHRTGHLDFVGVTQYDENHHVVGVHCFVGLYAPPVYHSSVRSIPVLRTKVEDVLLACAYVPGSHREKVLINILEAYPRDELIEVQADVLVRIAQDIVELQQHQRVRVFLREDPFGRYISVLVFMPRDNFDTSVRVRIANLLRASFGSDDIDFFVLLTESTLARIHFIARTPSRPRFEHDAAQLEQAVGKIASGWKDQLKHGLIAYFGEESGVAHFRKYSSVLPITYRDQVSPTEAVLDIERMEMLTTEAPLQVRLQASGADDIHHYHCKIFSVGSGMTLSECLPIFDNLGIEVLNEQPYCLNFGHENLICARDFSLLIPRGDSLQRKAVQKTVQELMTRLFLRQCENDGFNRLGLLAGLDVREIAVLRAYGRFMRLASLGFSQTYIEQCLARYPDIAKSFVELFAALFDPGAHDAQKAEHLAAKVRASLEKVTSLDEDRILDSYLTLILATLRTNYFQLDESGNPKNHLAFKFSSREIPFLPEPRPLYEIFVHGPRVEGVHLRGSRVARGGLRWSDRMEDYRTEVLGLVKAQMVKNAVIVPMGSKGGFICKHLPPTSDRDAWLAEGTACYRTFVSGLLDLTDNLVGGAIDPPTRVRRLDGDDPYLVVAADKGTATFSDIANQLALRRGFWLGDAFASGGSAGYDHKKMGITARGVWESVKRHFRHLGIDTQTTDFSVIGIGDMSGDVFGNGMLLSEHIKLIAAFDHRHIFLDPNPDTARSLAERRRLFALPRSSWDDYDRSLISEGGGVFTRSAKAIPLSATIRTWVGTDAQIVTPNELIRMILKAKADLLYNGGIGTYVKASTESHAEVNDRANDAIRINGRDLRVRVAAEGGNLGMTQRGRIEYAESAGRVCTDAIDNSAGVDCSDHEVNIKILLGQSSIVNQLPPAQRNELLAAMTDDVAQLVLRNNYLQTQAIAAESRIALVMLDTHARFLRALESSGELNRAMEFLPDDEVIAQRRKAGRGLAAPELAVLLAYSKISLDRAILESDLPDQPDFRSVLANYFPEPLRHRFAAAMGQHPLRREIIANQLANEIVNRMGPTFTFQMAEELDTSTPDVTRAWFAAKQIVQADELWEAIQALDNLVAADVQVSMLLSLSSALADVTRWLILKSPSPQNLTPFVHTYLDGVGEVLGAIESLLPGHQYEAIAKREMELLANGVTIRLARLFARADSIVTSLDLVDIAHQTHQPMATVGTVYFELDRAFGIDWLKRAVATLPQNNRWQSLARGALMWELRGVHRGLATSALTNSADTGGFIESWFSDREPLLAKMRQMHTELHHQHSVDFAALSVVIGDLQRCLLN